MTDTTIHAEVRDLGARWAAAERVGDTDALQPLLTDDFVGVGPLGYMLTKQQWLDRYTSGDFANQQFSWDDVTVRSYGQAAIAVGVQTQQATYKGRPSNGRFRLTQVLVCGDSGWRIAGLHLSPLADQPAPPST
ncbi:MAG TPA: nuclear transport factor 2 family protein [Actinomycetes bacterium]|jgi:ketosteroid isomerase-like protein|nr:nuclear transport factor 2 family protein [Actinomycetes bacterium]